MYKVSSAALAITLTNPPSDLSPFIKAIAAGDSLRRVEVRIAVDGHEIIMPAFLYESEIVNKPSDYMGGSLDGIHRNETTYEFQLKSTGAVRFVEPLAEVK